MQRVDIVIGHVLSFVVGFLHLTHFLSFFTQCKRAIEVGRAHRAGFADIGKVYVRMSKAAVKMGDKEKAISYLEDAQVTDL